MPTMPSRLKQCHCISDLRILAKQKLPRVMFDYMDGGAEDEVTLQRNREGFNRYQLIPETLVDVSSIDLSTTVQNSDIDLPLIFSPTGGTRFFHHQGEMAVAPVAESMKTIFTLSTMATTSIETIAATTSGTKWFQVYVWKDRNLVGEFIQRCKDNNYQALCLTVDSSTSGKRERDLRNGMVVPPRFTLSSLLDMGLHPAWWSRLLTSPPITFANMVDKAGQGENSTSALGQYVTEQLDPSVTWNDLAWMIKQWGGPFLIKGILSPDDARRAVDIGASGVIVSNHGGRQLDHAAAPVDMLPEIVEAVGTSIEIILDGGIRRGSDIIKALALGANACMIGRPFLYGLAAGGQPGVEHALEILKSELIRSMQLLGCTDVKKLNRKYLREIN